jgi:hypothetical protein
MSQLSVAVALPVLAGSVIAVHSIVTLPGHVIVGACVSITVIVCVHVAVAPQLSVAVHVRTNEYASSHAPGVDAPSA